MAHDSKRLRFALLDQPLAMLVRFRSGEEEFIEWGCAIGVFGLKVDRVGSLERRPLREVWLTHRAWIATSGACWC